MAALNTTHYNDFTKEKIPLDQSFLDLLTSNVQNDWLTDFNVSALQSPQPKQSPQGQSQGHSYHSMVAYPALLSLCDHSLYTPPPSAPVRGNDSGYSSFLDSPASKSQSVTLTPTSQPLTLPIPTKDIVESIYNNWIEETQGSSASEKPEESYVSLIAQCILSSPTGQVVLPDIYKFITDKHPYYRTAKPTWKNSVRHCLSADDCFVRGHRAKRGRGYIWSIHPACVESFRRGDFSRRKARRQAQRFSKLTSTLKAHSISSVKTENESVQMCSTPLHYNSKYSQTSSHTPYQVAKTTGSTFSQMIDSQALQRFLSMQGKISQVLGHHHQGYMSQTVAMEKRC